jgi:hypothetical protein
VNPSAPGAGVGTPRGIGRGPLPEHLASVRGKAGLGVAEVEPSSLLVRVVGRHRAGDVIILALGPHGERHAAGAHRTAGPRLRRRQRVKLRAEETNPEILVHRDPQEALADANERGCLRDRVRREVMKFHAVVVAEGPHEAARRRS